jgi:hypothetical protein
VFVFDAHTPKYALVHADNIYTTHTNTHTPFKHTTDGKYVPTLERGCVHLRPDLDMQYKSTTLYCVEVLASVFLLSVWVRFSQGRLRGKEGNKIQPVIVCHVMRVYVCLCVCVCVCVSM